MMAVATRHDRMAGIGLPMPHMFSSRDAIGGLLIAFIGGMFLYFAGDLRTGSIVQMGPGYLPKVLSWCLIGLGGLILAKSTVVVSEPIQWPSLRAVVPLVTATLLFALLLETAGLFITAALAIVVARLSISGLRWFSLETFLFAVGFSAGCGILFVVLLGQQIPLFPK